MGDEQRNKNIVRTVEQLWIDEKLDQLDQYFAPNDHSHDRPPFLPQGLAGAKIAHQGSMKSFKDRKLEMKDIFAEGDKVFVRSSFSAQYMGGVPGIAAPAVVAISAAMLVRAGRMLPDPRFTSRVRLAVLVGVFPLIAAFFIASSQTPERCSLSMGRCAAGTGATFMAVVSLAWLPLLYFLAGTLLAAVSHDLTKKAVAE